MELQEYVARKPGVTVAPSEVNRNVTLPDEVVNDPGLVNPVNELPEICGAETSAPS